ncbi:MAG: hypothetical protein ACRD16_01630 [Thermoanaerobaculia bacterium]
MITLLVVGAPEAFRIPAPPSVEILRCAGGDEALEILSRNRRIDAVLFLDATAAAETAALLEEEGPSWPPLFQVGRSSVPGTVAALDPGAVLEDLRRKLGE